MRNTEIRGYISKKLIKEYCNLYPYKKMLLYLYEHKKINFIY